MQKIRVPLLKIKKWHNDVQGGSKENSTLSLLPTKQRHEEKWDMMTMTMTMGMDACFAPWGDKLEQAYWQPTDYYCK